MSRGWVHVICGPMYSGKTEELIRLTARATISGKKLMVFSPNTDTRTDLITSRNGLSIPSIHIKTSLELPTGDTDVEVVAIEEAQFFDENFPYIVNDLAQAGVKVLVSGLDRDFLGRPFGPMPELLAIADKVTKLTAICFKCKRRATLTQRLVNGIPAKADDPLVVVGGMGDDKYEARCRNCWELG